MAITRRDLLATSTSLAGFAALHRLGLAQVATPDVPAPMPKTAAAKALYADVGAAAWAELYRKLNTANKDLVESGMRHIRGVNGTLLTG